MPSLEPVMMMVFATRVIPILWLFRLNRHGSIEYGGLPVAANYAAHQSISRV